MIALRPYSDAPAMAVLSRLDPWDILEAEAVRGEPVTHLGLFGDWRALQGVCLASWVVCDDETRTLPFGLLALSHTGQRGVAGAALLARDHRRFRRPLVQLARMIRAELPGVCTDHGIFRIEARAWSRHPRAATFLSLVGFRHEADMPGFGPDGSETFRQFAWTDPRCLAPAIPEDAPCAL